MQSPTGKSQVSAIVIPRVSCDLPVKPVTPKFSWDHLSDILPADPDFGHPSRIDLLLGVDIFVASLLHGRRVGSPGSPTALETNFCWILVGLVESQGHRRHTPHTMHLLPPETTCYANSGKLKKVQETISCVPWRSCLTSKKTITATKPFTRNPTHRQWLNLVHKRSEGFSLLNAYYTPRMNFRRSTM